jgi:hypothetical protein
MPTYRNLGDELRGDKITASARSISAIRVVQRTGKHGGQVTTLRDNAYCVIDLPLKIITQRKR